MTYELPELGFEYNALEPFIDEATMRVHHDKHHQGYTDKLNKAIGSHPELFEKTAEELLENLNVIPEDIKTAVRNNGGGYVNHNLFWEILKKDVEINGKIKELIERDFGSFENFKKEFSERAMSLFGSGWTWLILDGGKLNIVNTSNQDTPISEGKKPILTLDIWEHAYYLKYQNRRVEYVEAFFNVINWDKVNELLDEN